MQRSSGSAGVSWVSVVLRGSFRGSGRAAPPDLRMRTLATITESTKSLTRDPDKGTGLA